VIHILPLGIFFLYILTVIKIENLRKGEMFDSLNLQTIQKIESRIQTCGSSLPVLWEPILFNLAHTLRRLGKWSNGLVFF
jgi:hypothetical protein